MAMTTAKPARVAAERIWLEQVPVPLARTLAASEPAPPGSRPRAPGYPLPDTPVGARMFLRHADATGDDQWGLFQIILRETGEVIGDIGFHGPPDESGAVEIGYGIVEQYRGRGLVGESAIAICTLAWTRPEVTKIIGRTEIGAEASAGVLKHAGFHEGPITDGLRTFSLTAAP